MGLEQYHAEESLALSFHYSSLKNDEEKLKIKAGAGAGGWGWRLSNFFSLLVPQPMYPIPQHSTKMPKNVTIKCIFC